MNDLEFLNGSCAALALGLNSRYGFPIYHVMKVNLPDSDDDTDDDTDGVIHTSVRVNNDQYLDVTGIHTAAEVIRDWYEETCTIAQTTEIFLVDDSMRVKVSLNRGITHESLITQQDVYKYNLREELGYVDYSYYGKQSIEEICDFLVLKWGTVQ